MISSGDRHSHAEDALLLTDPEEIARREALAFVGKRERDAA